MTDKTEMLNKYQNNILRTKIVLPTVKMRLKKDRRWQLNSGKKIPACGPVLRRYQQNPAGCPPERATVMYLSAKKQLIQIVKHR